MGLALQPLPLWHLHELIFGFAGAALGGYLLTALPSWTGRELMSGRPLMLLLLLWCCARGVLFLADLLPMALILPAAGGYFFLLFALILPELLCVRAYSRLIFALFPLVLGGLDIAVLFTALTGEIWVSLALGRGVILGFCGLMILIGGRAVPAFTRNALALAGRGAQVRDGHRARRFGLILWSLTLVFLVLGWERSGFLTCLLCGCSLLWSMRDWQTVWALRDPLLAALHLSYLCLPLGFLVIGGNGLFGGPLPLADLLHLITIGAMAGLIMAISGRAAAHQPDGTMRTTGGFTIGFALVWFSTWARLAVAFVPDHGETLILVAVGAWCLGWLAFLIGFLPALKGPVLRPVLSGKRYPQLANSPVIEPK